MRGPILALAAVAVLLAPAPAHAWGFEAHRFIADRAVALLPAGLRTLFERERDRFVERAIDPDTWRIAGFEEEGKHHFLDLDWEGYGPYPHAQLPRDYAAAVARFGVEQVDRYGTLPWRVEEFYGRLRRAFEASARRGASGGFDIVFLSAALAHYVSDAHVPFHAVVNHDGQLTGQRGIHARFETVLFERYRDRLAIAPAARGPIRHPRDFVFDRILEGTQLARQVLEHDRAAAMGTRRYGDAYYDAFYARSGAVLERRLGESIAATAAIIAGAWEDAGRPPVPAELRR